MPRNTAGSRASVSVGYDVGGNVGAGAAGCARSRTVSVKLEISLSDALSRMWLVRVGVLCTCVVGKTENGLEQGADDEGGLAVLV